MEVDGYQTLSLMKSHCKMSITKDQSLKVSCSSREVAPNIHYIFLVKTVQEMLTFCHSSCDCGDGSDEQQCRKFVITVTVVQILHSPFLWADGELFKLCYSNQVEIQTNIGSCRSAFSLFPQ